MQMTYLVENTFENKMKIRLIIFRLVGNWKNRNKIRILKTRFTVCSKLNVEAETSAYQELHTKLQHQLVLEFLQVFYSPSSGEQNTAWPVVEYRSSKSILCI